jgi:arsenate reductase
MATQLRDLDKIYPAKRYEDWELEDPADADLDGVRRIRDEIARRVGRLADELAPALAP